MAEDLSDGDAARMGERPLAAVGAAGGAYGGPGDGLQNDIHSDDDSGSPASSSGSSHGHGGEGHKSLAKAWEQDAVIRAANCQGTGEGLKKGNGSIKGKQLKRARGGKENAYGQGGKCKAAPKGPRGAPKRQKKLS